MPRGDLARLVLMQLLANACLTGMRMAAPLHALRLGHGEVAVGILLALFSVSQTFLALPAGADAPCWAQLREWAMLFTAMLGTGLLFALYPFMSAAVAMRVMVNNASSVGVPMLCGVAGSVFGAAPVFWGAGLVVGAGSRLALKLRKPQPR